ncbi:MAG: hypothetical protein QOJ08_680 [Ilumatobacteraceae bacterium]
MSSTCVPAASRIRKPANAARATKDSNHGVAAAMTAATCLPQLATREIREEVATGEAGPQRARNAATQQLLRQPAAVGQLAMTVKLVPNGRGPRGKRRSDHLPMSRSNSFRTY